MTTVQQEKALTINALMKFKETFPRGFKGVFSGNNIASLKEHWEADIDGLLTPIENEVNSIVTKLLSETGLVTAIGKLTTKVADIITEITKNEGVKAFLKVVSVIIDAIVVVAGFILGLISDVIKLLEKIFGELPPPPSDDPVGVIPDPRLIIWDPIPDPDQVDDPYGLDPGDFGWH